MHEGEVEFLSPEEEHNRFLVKVYQVNDLVRYPGDAGGRSPAWTNSPR